MWRLLLSHCCQTCEQTVAGERLRREPQFWRQVWTALCVGHCCLVSWSGQRRRFRSGAGRGQQSLTSFFSNDSLTMSKFSNDGCLSNFFFLFLLGGGTGQSSEDSFGSVSGFASCGSSLRGVITASSAGIMDTAAGS